MTCKSQVKKRLNNDRSRPSTRPALTGVINETNPLYDRRSACCCRLRAGRRTNGSTERPIAAGVGAARGHHRGNQTRHGKRRTEIRSARRLPGPIHAYAGTVATVRASRRNAWRDGAGTNGSAGRSGTGPAYAEATPTGAEVTTPPTATRICTSFVT